MKLILYIRRIFNLKISTGEPEIKENLEKVYKQTTLLKVLDHSTSILLLTLFRQESPTALHARALLEIYLQARLLRTIDSEAGYHSFWHFAAFNEYCNMKIIISDTKVIEKEFKDILNTKIAEYEEANIEKLYTDQLLPFIKDFKAVFPKSKTKLKKNCNWWAGLSPKDIAILFPDGALEIYYKLYWDLSSDTHSNPRSSIDYALINEIGRRKALNSLVQGINLTIWIAELFTENKEDEQKFKKIMSKLSNLLLNYYGRDENKNKLNKQ